MTCPRCGAITESFPCPVCGCQQQELPRPEPRPRRRRPRADRLALVVLAGLLILGLVVFGVSQVLFSGKWNEPAQSPQEPAPPADSTLETPPEPEPEPEPALPPRFTVVVDPGHGGTQQPGVVSGDLCEKVINLQVARKLKALLEAENIEVIMTRTEDLYLGLAERIELANGIGADCFVSIHCNSYDNSKVRGFEMFYYKSAKDGKQLAEAIRTAADGLGIITRECNVGNYQVLRDAKVPATLAEIGYFTNSAELALLQDDDYQETVARAIMTGMIAYLENR